MYFFSLNFKKYARNQIQHLRQEQLPIFEIMQETKIPDLKTENKSMDS